MSSEEEVFNIAQSGNDYLAVERSAFVVRKLKKQKRNTDAIIFLMNLAHKLIDLNKPVSSAVSACRAIEIIAASENKEVSDEIKSNILSYIDKLTPLHSCLDLYAFFDSLSQLFSDNYLDILKKEAIIADKSESYNQAQIVYIRIVVIQVKKEEDTSETFSQLANLLWRWVNSIKDEKEKVYTGQFIFCRCALAISAQDEKCLDLAMNFLKQIIETNTENVIVAQPLFTFTRYFLKALRQNSPQSVSFLINSYKKLISEVDREIMKWVSKNKEVHFHPEQSTIGMSGIGGIGSMGGFGSILQSLFGGGMQNNNH